MLYLDKLGRRWRSGYSGRPIQPVAAQTSSQVLPRCGVGLGVEAGCAVFAPLRRLGWAL